MRGDTHCLYALLASYPVAMTKLEQKPLQREKIYFGSQFKVAQSSAEGKSRQQEPEATGTSHPQSEQRGGCLLLSGSLSLSLSLHSYSLGSQPGNGTTHSWQASPLKEYNQDNQMCPELCVLGDPRLIK